MQRAPAGAKEDFSFAPAGAPINPNPYRGFACRLTPGYFLAAAPRLKTSSHRLFNPAQPGAMLTCDLVVAGQKLQPRSGGKKIAGGERFFCEPPDQVGDAKSPGRGERRFFFRPCRGSYQPKSLPGVRLPAHPRLFSGRRSAAQNLQSQVVQSGVTGGGADL